MADSAPELLGRAHAVLGLSDWLAYRLSGKMVAEPSVASESGLFEVSARRWADDLIRSLGLPRHLFPEVVSSGTALGPLGKDAAAHLGLQPGIPVVTGGGDAQCGLLGADAVDSGEMGIVAGLTMPMQSVLYRGSLMMRRACGRHTMSFRGAGRLSPMGGLSGECPTVRSLRRALDTTPLSSDPCQSTLPYPAVIRLSLR